MPLFIYRLQRTVACKSDEVTKSVLRVRIGADSAVPSPTADTKDIPMAVFPALIRQ